MSRATYFSLLEEGLTAAAIMMLSEQTPPGVSWVPLLVVLVALKTTTVPLSLRTQMLLRVNYVSKKSEILGNKGLLC